MLGVVKIMATGKYICMSPIVLVNPLFVITQTARTEAISAILEH